MRSSIASCEQTCCKLIIQTCYQQACCKLFQQVVTSLPMTSLLKAGLLQPVNSIFLISGTITFSHSIGKKMKHRYLSFTRIGRQFQSLERKVYADWTSVSFPFCQRSCLIWRIMTNTLTNTMTNTYVVIFLSVSIFGRGYHSRYQNFEFTGCNLMKLT